MDTKKEHLAELGDLAMRLYWERFDHHTRDGIVRDEMARRLAYREACAAVGEKPLGDEGLS